MTRYASMVLFVFVAVATGGLGFAQQPGEKPAPGDRKPAPQKKQEKQEKPTPPKENAGQEDLDRATEAKLSATTLSDLGEVIRLCGSALEKGLDKENTKFAKTLLGSTLIQRGTTVAAAVLGDKTKVKYVPTTGETRFTALASGEIDLLVRNSTWTFKRENDLKLTFVAVNYYDGQGFMVPKALGVSSAKELDGATVCVQTGTTTELNLADYFKQNSMSYTPINVKGSAEGKQQFMNGGCDVYTTDRSGLASLRATFPKPDDYVILPETISKEPLGPVVRQGDEQWASIVRWTTFALMEAEELGVTSANIDELAKGTRTPR